MKGKLAFLLGMALGQCFVCRGGNFKSLGDVFVNWQGRYGWDSAFKQTHNVTRRIVENIKEGRNYECGVDDLKAIRAFAVSFPCLENLSVAAKFSEYGTWLKGICSIAYNIALQKDPDACSGLEGLPEQLSSDSSIESLFTDAKFLNRIKLIGDILTDAINWTEDE